VRPAATIRVAALLNMSLRLLYARPGDPPPG
jgi:hypothetical protein